MAKLVGVFNMSHTPFCYIPPENWNAIRATRTLRADVPMDDIESNTAKFERIQKAFGTLRAKLAWILITGVPLFANATLLMLPFVMPEFESWQ